MKMWNLSNVITWGHQLFRIVLLGETCKYDLPAPSKHAQTLLKKVYLGLCEASQLNLCPKFSDRTTQSRAVRNPLLRSSQWWRSCIRKLLFKQRFFVALSHCADFSPSFELQFVHPFVLPPVMQLSNISIPPQKRTFFSRSYRLFSRSV